MSKNNVNLDEAPKPWEMQPGETAKAYAAFTRYRDMGTDNRSIRTVAQMLSKSVTVIRRWSGAWEWVKRVKAWDVEVDRLAREKEIKTIKDMTERHAKAAMSIQGKALEALQKLQASDMTPADIIRFMDVAVKIERLSRGEATEQIKQEGEVKHGHGLDDTTKKIITDPAAADLACQLFERITMGQGNASGIREVREQGEMDNGEAPGPIKP